MAIDTKNGGPCSGGLTASCFASHPAFARRAFAYRLLHTVTPKPLARKLPEILSRALIGEGAQVPAGWNLPPGTVVPPGTILPPPPREPVGDIPGGEPLVGEPGAPVPTPVAPLPAGTLPPSSGALPPETTSFVPPIYVPPWTPGPIDVPGKNKVTGGASVGRVVVYTTAGDGSMSYYNAVWSTARNQVSGANLDTTSWGGVAVRAALLTGDYTIYRSFYYFNLAASIPVGATITAATLRLAGYGFTGNTISVQEGTQGTPLTTGDYDEFTGNSFANVVWQADTYPAIKYNDLVFNAEGIAYLQGIVAGTALLCCRDYAGDYLNVAPITSPIQCNVLYSEVGDGNAPNLIIDYTL